MCVIGLYYLEVLTLLYKRYQSTKKIYATASQIIPKKITLKSENAHRFAVYQYQPVEQECLLSSVL